MDKIQKDCKNIFLREVRENDINDNYLSWLNDSEVTYFLETRHYLQTMESLKKYWLEHHSDKNSPWFAICLRNNQRHIGNIKIGPINWIHRRADIGLFIGHKKSWGKGYGFESIILASKFAFKELKLRKLNAGIYKDNISSIKVFEKAGFKLEGIFREEGFYEDKPRDVLKFGLLAHEFYF